jgi:putative Mn2+ efflux pump MntP
MPLFSVLLVAVALALDACAVAVGARASGQARGSRALFRLSFHFGLFQGAMPVAGWFAGRLVAGAVAAFDHWLAFGVLAVIGGRMIHAGCADAPGTSRPDPSRGITLVMLSIATSIDALAVGFGLALAGVAIWTPAVVIGLVTAALVVVAAWLGDRLGARLGPRAEIVGGVILVLVGLRLLLSHLLA